MGSGDNYSALLALNGKLPSGKTIFSLLSQSQLIVAADGAALQLKEHNIAPNVIIGDLDSIGKQRSHEFFKNTRIVERPSQDSHDGEKALRWLLHQGFTSVKVIGALGDMIDHSLNNLSILSNFADKVSITLHDDLSIGYFATSDFQRSVSPGDRISLIPIATTRLTTEGLRWDLRDETLSFGTRTSTSNEAISNLVTLSIANGTLLLIHFPSHAL